ncbi:MAG: MmcQ/YjbR family DNA-binding protein [Candidatus Dormibacteria bacterium]
MDPEAAFLRLRGICRGFPEVVEDPDGVGDPSFKVKGKIFVMHVVDHHGDGETAFWCKARAGTQQALTASDPARYFVPPYVGRYGWVGVRLDRPVDWTEAEGLIEDSYRLTAPKRLTSSL